jgi:hypothetical protein
MLKLKSLLGEGFAWERKEGKPLPSLAEVQAEYERNLKEETEYKVSGRPVTINKNGSDDQTKWTVTVTDTGKTAQYSSVASLISPRPKLQDPRWWDSDGDGKPYEPGDDVKSIKEGWNDRSISDLVESAQELVNNLKSNMATNSVLQQEEKLYYLNGFDSLEKILNDIENQAEPDEEDDIRGWR